MKACFKQVNNLYTPNQINVLKDFTKFLSTKLPLNNDIYITFLEKKEGPMTTGVRKPGSEISVLAGKRLLIDVLRTLSHEWVHEYQHQKMGLKDTDKIKDIGGSEENMANTLSGIFVKKFEKTFPKYENILYGEE
jgi:hypothetical protein